MKQHHKWELEYLESLAPWELQVYVELLKNHVEEENKKLKEEIQKRNAGK